MAGDGLPPRDETFGYGTLPEAYATIQILPKDNDASIVQTEVSPPSLNPIWNATISFKNITNDSLLDRSIEVSLYDLLPQSEPVFLGECKVKLQKAFLDDIAVWYRLEDPKLLRGVPLKTNWTSPRNSISGDVTKLIRGSDYRFQRSVSDDVDSIGEGSLLLHPDHALGFHRRGSSQSETIEIESYQLGKDISKSLPGSRRSSFQDQDKIKSGEITPTFGYGRGRRRSSTTKNSSDDALRAFNNSKGEFTRTMSLSRELERKNSKRSLNQSLSEKNNEQIERMISCIKNRVDGHRDIDPEQSPISYLSSLGPGQVIPKHCSSTMKCVGELRVAVNVDKAVLELKILYARNLISKNCDTALDTYVKCYLRDGDRLRHKKKSKVVKNSKEPQYNQIFKYSASELFGRTILMTVWQKTTGFEHNQNIGGAELFFNIYKVKTPIEHWYPIFPSHYVLHNQLDSP